MKITDAVVYVTVPIATLGAVFITKDASCLWLLVGMFILYSTKD